MSRYIQNKGFSVIIATLVALMSIMFITLLGKFGFLNFADTTIKVTRDIETNTKVFTLLHSTKDGESLEKLIARSVVDGNDNEDLKNLMKDEIGKMEQETKTTSYHFYVVFDGKKYFELQNLPKQSFSVPSTVVIAVPYNSKALTAEVNFIEW